MSAAGRLKWLPFSKCYEIYVKCVRAPQDPRVLAAVKTIAKWVNTPSIMCEMSECHCMYPKQWRRWGVATLHVRCDPYIVYFVCFVIWRCWRAEKDYGQGEEVRRNLHNLNVGKEILHLTGGYNQTVQRQYQHRKRALSWLEISDYMLGQCDQWYCAKSRWPWQWPHLLDCRIKGKHLRWSLIFLYGK